MTRKTLMKLLILSLLMTALVTAVIAASDDQTPAIDQVTTVTTDPTPAPDVAVSNKAPVFKPTIVRPTETPIVDFSPSVTEAAPTEEVVETTTPGVTPEKIEGMTQEEYDQAVENARNVNGKVTGPSGVILHYDIYMTDGYINTDSGTLSGTDSTSIAGWPYPVYIWGLTDIDPNIPGNNFTVPAGAYGSPGNTLPAPVGTIDRNTGQPASVATGLVGNARLPGPYIQATVGDDVYITFHNRGMLQNLQSVEDDHSLHFHGIHAQSQYDGFPESAGGYTEQLRYFWEEPWYIALGADTLTRDTAWNAMTGAQQQNYLRTNTPLIKENKLNAGGGVTNQFNTAPYPDGVGGLTPAEREAFTQFTYYWRAQQAGTYMYHCHVAASEHVQMGMYGSLHIHPADNSMSVYGAGTGTDYDKEYTMYLTSIDPVWHSTIESGTTVGFNPPDWKPQLWLTNGRTFPMTLFPHADNMPGGAPARLEPIYDTYIKVKVGQKWLTRWVNMDYSDHSPHQHGWHMKIVGTDAVQLTTPYDKFTLNIGSGETYDAITLADPVYGVNYPSGSPLAAQNSPRGSLNWRQIFPQHDHYDYQVTTNGIYPGGGVTLIEATNLDGSASGKNPTWANPFTGTIDPIPTNI